MRCAPSTLGVAGRSYTPNGVPKCQIPLPRWVVASHEHTRQADDSDAAVTRLATRNSHPGGKAHDQGTLLRFGHILVVPVLCDLWLYLN